MITDKSSGQIFIGLNFYQFTRIPNFFGVLANRSSYFHTDQFLLVSERRPRRKQLYTSVEISPSISIYLPIARHDAVSANVIRHGRLDVLALELSLRSDDLLAYIYNGNPSMIIWSWSYAKKLRTFNLCIPLRLALPLIAKHRTQMSFLRNFYFENIIAVLICNMKF